MVFEQVDPRQGFDSIDAREVAVVVGTRYGIVVSEMLMKTALTSPASESLEDSLPLIARSREAVRVTKEEIFERVRTILVDSFELDLQSVHPTAHLMEDLDLDSIDAIDMAVAIESETGIDVSEAELRSLRIVQDAVDLIHRRLGG